MRDVHQMLARFRGESAQRIKVSMAATALHQCVQSLRMKMSVWRLLLRPNLDQRQPHAGGEGGGDGGRRPRFGAHGDLCIKRKSARCIEQICPCMGMVIIISGEICQFAFASLRGGRPYQTGAADSWLPAGPNEVCFFSRSPKWPFYCTSAV